MHIRRLVRAGKFPQRLKIGDRKLGWRTSTITRYVETRENIANSAFTSNIEPPSYEDGSMSFWKQV